MKRRGFFQAMGAALGAAALGPQAAKVVGATDWVPLPSHGDIRWSGGSGATVIHGVCPKPVTLRPNEHALFYYDAADEKWILMSKVRA